MGPLESSFLRTIDELIRGHTPLAPSASATSGSQALLARLEALGVSTRPELRINMRERSVTTARQVWVEASTAVSEGSGPNQEFVLSAALRVLCKGGEWCAPDRLLRDPIYQVLSASGPSFETSLYREGAGREADGDWEAWGHAHRLHLYAGVGPAGVPRLFDDLANYPIHALIRSPIPFYNRWELALAVPEPATVLHHWNEQLRVRSVSDSLVEHFDVSFSHPQEKQGWIVGCAIAGARRFASMDELRELAKHTLEAEGWTELVFQTSRRSESDQAEIIFRGTRPSGQYRSFYVVRP